MSMILGEDDVRWVVEMMILWMMRVLVEEKGILRLRMWLA